MQPRKLFDNVADSFCHFVRCERGYPMKNEAEVKQIASFFISIFKIISIFGAEKRRIR